jgi:hypothetical protein
MLCKVDIFFYIKRDRYFLKFYCQVVLPGHHGSDHVGARDEVGGY